MTRAEFLAERAKADFIKKYGVTQCAPGTAWLPQVQTARARHARGHDGLGRAQLIADHAHEEESGEIVPVTMAKKMSRRVG